MQPEQPQQLSKIQTTAQFDKIFEDQTNTNCFHCGKKSKQWAQTKHAVFLCLTCAALYRDVMKIVNVKSISLDLWTDQEIKLLRVGGNARFRKYLEVYGLYGQEPKISLRSTAAEYYRKNVMYLCIQLVASVKQLPIGEPPSVQQGKKPFVAQIPLTEMTSDQVIQQAKQRLTWAGQKTKYYGTKAFDKVHHKVTSGQLKQDAKKAAQKVSTKAKDLWSFVASKIGQLQKPKQQKPAEL